MVRSPYPPLFPLIWSALVPLAGPRSGLVGCCRYCRRRPGRRWSAWNAWRVRCGIWPCIAAVGLVAASPFVYQWAGYARVDMLALLFAAAASSRAQWLGGWKAWSRRPLLCGLALWTKQTTLTATVAVGLALAAAVAADAAPRSWLLVGVPSAARSRLALNAATDGEFARHVLAGNASNPIVPICAHRLCRSRSWRCTCRRSAPAVVAAARAGPLPSPVALYLPIALLASLSAGNGGSSVNYLLEPLLALALAVPFAWRALPPRGGRRRADAGRASSWPCWCTGRTRSARPISAKARSGRTPDSRRTRRSAPTWTISSGPSPAR